MKPVKKCKKKRPRYLQPDHHQKNTKKLGNATLQPIPRKNLNLNAIPAAPSFLYTNDFTSSCTLIFQSCRYSSSAECQMTIRSQQVTARFLFMSPVKGTKTATVHQQVLLGNNIINIRRYEKHHCYLLLSRNFPVKEADIRNRLTAVHFRSRLYIVDSAPK